MIISKRIKRLIKDVIVSNASDSLKKDLKSTIMEEAVRERHLEVVRLTPSFFYTSIDGHQILFKKMNGLLSSDSLKEICDDKFFTREMIKKVGVSVPESLKANLKDKEKIITFSKTIGFPLVIKPINSSRGNGVYTDITDEKELIKRLNLLADTLGTKNIEILIEKQYFGNDYRIFIVNDEVISVTKRARANVIGDGYSKIIDLIHKKNEMRKKNRYLSHYLIPTDKKKLLKLYRDGKSLEYIPSSRELVVLRDESNLSAGGDSIDYTETIHPIFKEIALKSIQAIPGLKYAGVDIIVEDITAQPSEGTYAVTEIEFSPAPLSLYPWEGKPRNMALAIIDFYISLYSK